MPKESNRSRFVWALLLVGVAAVYGGGNAVAQDDEARALLQQMGEALREHSYDGTFVYTRDGLIETLRIVRSADGEGAQERIYTLSGRAWELFRGNDKALAVVAERGISGEPAYFPIMAGMAFRRGNPRVAEEIGSHYAVELLGEDRVADRAAWVVAIEPADRLRYARRFWIDQESYLPLQAQVRDGGKVVERLLCTRIEIDGSAVEVFLEPEAGASAVIQEQLDRGAGSIESGATRWHVVELPAGFQLALEGKFRLQSAEGGGPGPAVEHLLYSDGLANVSVYVVSGTEAHRGRMRVGALHAAELPIDGYQITVVGDVPAETVESFVHGVRKR